MRDVVILFVHLIVTLAGLARPENRWMEFSVGTDRLYANAAAAAHVAEAGGDLRVPSPYVALI